MSDDQFNEPGNAEADLEMEKILGPAKQTTAERIAAMQERILFLETEIARLEVAQDTNNTHGEQINRHQADLARAEKLLADFQSQEEQGSN